MNGLGTGKPSATASVGKYSSATSATAARTSTRSTRALNLPVGNARMSQISPASTIHPATRPML